MTTTSKKKETTSVGELSNACSQIVLKCLYLAKIGRLDVLWSVNKLARSITKWTKACDKRLNRLISFLHRTFEYKQYCHVGNTAKQCRLGLFQDSDFAGDLEDSKSTSGGTLCIFESHTFVPISWMCKKQTACPPQHDDNGTFSCGLAVAQKRIRGCVHSRPTDNMFWVLLGTSWIFSWWFAEMMRRWGCFWCVWGCRWWDSHGVRILLFLVGLRVQIVILSSIVESTAREGLEHLVLCVVERLMVCEHLGWRDPSSPVASSAWAVASSEELAHSSQWQGVLRRRRDKPSSLQFWCVFRRGRDRPSSSQRQSTGNFCVRSRLLRKKRDCTPALFLTPTVSISVVAYHGGRIGTLFSSSQWQGVLRRRRDKPSFLQFKREFRRDRPSSSFIPSTSQRQCVRYHAADVWSDTPSVWVGVGQLHKWGVPVVPSILSVGCLVSCTWVQVCAGRDVLRHRWYFGWRHWVTNVFRDVSRQIYGVGWRWAYENRGSHKTAPTHPPNAGGGEFGRVAVRDASVIPCRGALGVRGAQYWGASATPPRAVLGRYKGIHCLSVWFFPLFFDTVLVGMAVVQTLEGRRHTSRTLQMSVVIRVGHVTSHSAQRHTMQSSFSLIAHHIAWLKLWACLISFMHEVSVTLRLGVLHSFPHFSSHSP